MFWSGPSLPPTGLTLYKHLDIDITDDDRLLRINGQPVFPPPQTFSPIVLEAEQVRSSDGVHSQPLRLGYALEILPSITEVTDVILTPIQLTILDLQGISVGVDTVKIDLIQTWGHMHIAKVDTIAYTQSPGADQCRTSICRLRAIIADRLQKMVDAAKAHAGKAKTWIKTGCAGRKHAQANAEQDPTRGHVPHTRHRHNRLRHFVHQTVHFFILPVCFGILGGLAACGIGMLVGQGLARCISYRSRQVENVESAVEQDEKDVLMDHGEMPPQYEVLDVVVVEEK